MKAKAHIVHRLLGRVRFRIPDRRGDRAFFDDLGTRLGRSAAINRVEASPVTGSVLLYHEGDFDDLVKDLGGSEVGELVELEMGIPPVAHRLRAEVTAIDQSIRQLTGGELDLSTLASLGLIGIAGVQGLRGQQPVFAVSLVWYAAELIRRWGRPHPSAAA